ncbi:MAG: dihydrofolate reductase family protein [Tannerellaceae bacterium]|jgi:dihydrofolate reductase|nr:dihydrofolate reductase family protein [Tannerellaceae bacterium]
MKELKLLAFVSIDGYSSRLNGDMDWVYSGDRSPLEVYDFTSFFASIDRVVMNRMQYLALHFQDYIWPIRDKRCFVLTGKGSPVPIYSRGLLRFELLTGDDDNGKNTLQYVHELRSQSGEGDIWVMGDYRLTAALLQQDMIDEINILRLPVTLGSGISFLAGFGAERSWQLCQVSECAGGAILTRYHRFASASAQIAG